jgi:hypothetical protein
VDKITHHVEACATNQAGKTDKPSLRPSHTVYAHIFRQRRSDAYHTCYVLSGLSSAQHNVSVATEPDSLGRVTWEVTPEARIGVFDEADRVNPTDPVYAIPQDKRKQIMAYFEAKAGF